MTDTNPSNAAMNRFIRGETPPSAQPTSTAQPPPDSDQAWIEEAVAAEAARQNFLSPEDVVSLLLGSEKYFGMLSRPPGGGRPTNIPGVVREIRRDRPFWLEDAEREPVRAPRGMNQQIRDGFNRTRIG